MVEYLHWTAPNHVLPRTVTLIVASTAPDGFLRVTWYGPESERRASLMTSSAWLSVVCNTTQLIIRYMTRAHTHRHTLFARENKEYIKQTYSTPPLHIYNIKKMYIKKHTNLYNPTHLLLIFMQMVQHIIGSYCRIQKEKIINITMSWYICIAS